MLLNSAIDNETFLYNTINIPWHCHQGESWDKIIMLHTLSSYIVALYNKIQ